MHSLIKLGSAMILGLSLCASAWASPIMYSFTEGGFDGGATVTGTFTGNDINSDGELTYGLGANELTGFDMHFSGNSLVPAFSMNIGDLGGFVYGLYLGPYLGDDDVGSLEGIGGTGPDYQPYAVGPGPFALCDGTQPCGFVANADDSARSYSSEAVFVAPLTSVPEPSDLVLLALGLIGIGVFYQRRRREQSR